MNNIDNIGDDRNGNKNCTYDDGTALILLSKRNIGLDNEISINDDTSVPIRQLNCTNINHLCDNSINDTEKCIDYVLILLSELSKRNYDDDNNVSVPITYVLSSNHNYKKDSNDNKGNHNNCNALILYQDRFLHDASIIETNALIYIDRGNEDNIGNSNNTDVNDKVLCIVIIVPKSIDNDDYENVVTLLLNLSYRTNRKNKESIESNITNAVMSLVTNKERSDESSSSYNDSDDHDHTVLDIETCSTKMFSENEPSNTTYFDCYVNHDIGIITKEKRTLLINVSTTLMGNNEYDKSDINDNNKTDTYECTGNNVTNNASSGDESINTSQLGLFMGSVCTQLFCLVLVMGNHSILTTYIQEYYYDMIHSP